MLRRSLLALLVLAAPGANASLVPPAPCTVHGKMVGAANVWAAADGHQLLVRLHGGTRWLDASGFSPGARRVHVHSGTDVPSLLVDGFADWSEVPIALKSDFVVTPPVLAIRANVPLRLIETGTSLVATPFKPTFRDVHAGVSCADLHHAAEDGPPPLPKGGVERGLADHRLDLYASPGGPQLLSLETPKFPHVLVYETQSDFVHVRFVDDVVIDGWTRKGTLVDPQEDVGEMFGLLGGSGWGSSGGYQYAIRDTDVRLGPRETAMRVGILEKGARVVHWGGKANADGWVEVRIYDADAEEPPGKAFFVKSADLGSKP